MKFGLILIFAFALSPAAIAQAKSKTVMFEGMKVSYSDTGRATDKAILFVHCWTCNSEFWRESVNAFPDQRVIALDLPGHGASDKPQIDYSIDLFARSVDAVMRDAGIKRAVLVGHSMGTPVIRKYYELYPTKTLGLVIVDGALLPFGPRPDVEKFFAPMLADYRANVPKFLDGMLPTTDEKLREFVRSSMLATPDHVGSSAMRLMIADSYGKHGKIKVPVLAVMSPAGQWPQDLEKNYRSIAPKLEFLMWAGTSHFLHMERPKEFNDAVAGFVARNKLL